MSLSGCTDHDLCDAGGPGGAGDGHQAPVTPGDGDGDGDGDNGNDGHHDPITSGAKVQEQEKKE